MPFRLAEANGGNMRNAIPREAVATLLVAPVDAPAFEAGVAAFADRLRREFEEKEPELQVAFADPPQVEQLLPADLQGPLVDAICDCPNGVARMSDTLPGLVETSSNLSIIRIGGGRVEIQSLVRSAVETAREALCRAIAAHFEPIGAETGFGGRYPGWEPDPDAEVLRLAEAAYRDLFGEPARVGAIHAGLECGLLGAIYPDWEMLSFGPTIESPHSPDERVNIPSVARFWALLTELLRRIP